MERDPLRRPETRPDEYSSPAHTSSDEEVRRVLQAGERGEEHQHESTAERFKDKAQEASENIQREAQSRMHQASDKTNQVMSNAGQRMEQMAHTVRERAPEGRVGELATQGAQALERGGRYLQNTGPDEVRSDLENLIRRHPKESLVVGLGLGYLLSRATRRR